MNIIAILLIYGFWQFVSGNTLSEKYNDSTDTIIIIKPGQTFWDRFKINDKSQDTLKKPSFNELMDLLKSNQSSINDTTTDWITIQRRQDGSVDFFRNWTDYKQGFGNESGEFFIGLDRLHNITDNGITYELLIVLEDFNNQSVYAKYDKFVIGSELEKYALKELGKYSGDAGDSLGPLKGQKFSTIDQKNDNFLINCNEFYKGGWWFDKCFVDACHLNGPYIKKITSDLKIEGIIWVKWQGYSYSLKTVEMMIRPITSSNQTVLD